MKIYVAGDSWVYGDGLKSPNTQAWPAVLGNKLGAEVYNDSCLSGSNEHFVYRAIKHLEKDIDLYIIVWTSVAKFTFYKSDNNFEAHFNPLLVHKFFGEEDYYKIWGRTLFQVWYNRLYAFKLWLQQIIQLQTMFIRYNKNYLMLNTHYNDLDRWLNPWPEFIDSVKKLINFDLMTDEQIRAEYDEIQFYLRQIDTNRFYGWNSFYLHQLKSILIANNHWLGNHPTADGHMYIADMLYDSAKKYV
jgi:lysophospholipase L1-like esterase